ncbi:MAG: SprT-like domain-containing protein [Pseudomonadota bacterium]
MNIFSTEKLFQGLSETSVNAQLHASFEHLFNLLNDELFAPYSRDSNGFKTGRTPDCILCIERFKKRYRGFAAKAVWSDKHDRRLDQITVVLDRGCPLDTYGIASTLAHEMVHALQFRDGTIGLGNYHNADFRDRMKSIGLQTSHTGKPGGRDVGTGMSHYVIEDGPFDRVMSAIIAEGFEFPVDAVDPEPEPLIAKGKAKSSLPNIDKSKMKFFCPRCGQVARANITAQLRCGRTNCQSERMLIDY